MTRTDFSVKKIKASDHLNNKILDSSVAKIQTNEQKKKPVLEIKVELSGCAEVKKRICGVIATQKLEW